jgi:exopolysaccharide production protein ExoZ
VVNNFIARFADSGIVMEDKTSHSALIDVVRGIAAIQVVISHAVTTDMVFWGVGFGAITGVYLFFILSGFLIWSSASRVLPTERGLYTYAVHRVSRIMPLYYLSLIVAVTLVPIVAHFPQEITAYSIIRHVFFTQTLVPVDYKDINPVLWTLSLEAVFYVVVPGLFLVSSRLSFLLILLAAVVAFKIPSYLPDTTFSYFFSYFYLFVIGMALAQYRWLISMPFALLVVIVSAAVWAIDMDRRMICAAIATSTFLSVLLASRWQHSWTMRSLAFVGMISYSLYVWHYLLIDAVATPLVPYVQSKWGRAVVLITISIAFAWLSYRIIEAPGQAWLRSILLPRRKVLKVHSAPET